MRTTATKQPYQAPIHQKPVRATPEPVARSLFTGLTGSAMLQRKPGCATWWFRWWWRWYSGSAMLQRKPGCACGGGCPRCQEQTLLQTNLKISELGDRYEQEADLIADRVMQMPEPSVQRQMEPEEDEEEGMVQKEIANQITPLVQRQVLPEIEEDEEGVIQTKAIDDRAAPSNSTQNTSEVSPLFYKVLNSPGQPLDAYTQNFMASRLKHDLSHVRIHTDEKAATAAKTLNAQAYTFGNQLIFAKGRYAPHTTEGQYLLAHELVHFIQQQTSAPKLQKKLAVNPSHPSLAPLSDPAASLTSLQRLSMMDNLIQGLCDEFEVEPNTGEVLTKSLTSPDPNDLVAGSKPAGCCCLNILMRATTPWIIEVSQVVGPQTLSQTHQVVLSPTNTPVEFGSFTGTGTLAFQGNVPAAGHELCGHAALEELSAHPSSQDRTITDVHDPTVRIENLIATEQGVPATDLRGLAGAGLHRGESVDRITIQNYPFRGTNVPSTELSKLQFAVDYIKENESFVDILGHSDNKGSATAKQGTSDIRASKVKTELINRGVPSNITKFGLTGVNRFTHVEGVSDTQPPPPPLQANLQNWRRVEILIAGFPAGAQNPPIGTPTTVTPHVQSPNVPTLKTSADPCTQFLVSGAYP
jgi:outer membrane protein OmpA-like peptidoglycan-associated protein